MTNHIQGEGLTADRLRENDIPDTHMAFARELIALARAHGMNNLNVEFDHTADRVDWSAPHRDTKTHFVWKDGRHGAQTKIYMTRTEAIRFEETEPKGAS